MRTETAPTLPAGPLLGMLLPAVLLPAMLLSGCSEVAEYRVLNREIEKSAPTMDNHLHSVKILEAGTLGSELPMPRLPHTDRVRLTLPRYGAANGHISIASAWDESSPAVRVLLEFEGWREVDFSDANQSYKGARLHVPCAGWSLEIEGRSYPVTPGFCSGEIKLGDGRYESAVLRFDAPRKSAARFILRSPTWIMDDGLLNGLPESERTRFKVQPPEMVFERKVTRVLALPDYAKH